MEVKSKVRTMGQRKSVEIPKAVRDSFAVGETVIVKKINKKMKGD